MAKPMFLPKVSEEIFSLLRMHPRFWSAAEIAVEIDRDGEEADIEKILSHHADCKRFAKVPACERCNPLLNKTQTCRHPGSYYAFKILLEGIQVLEQHEKRQGKKNDDA